MSFMCTKTEEVEAVVPRPKTGRIPIQWYFDVAKTCEFSLTYPCKLYFLLIINKQFYLVPDCSKPKLDQPFKCMEMTYISALLSHGFGLPMDKQLNVRCLQFNALGTVNQI